MWKEGERALSGREKRTQYVGEMGGERRTHKLAAVHKGFEDYAENTLQREEWSDGWHSKQNVEE